MGRSNEFESKILKKFKEIIKITFKSCFSKLNKNALQNTFEIFGFDFIVDADLNSWLIEVNTNPCIEESSSLLKILLPRMIDDCFKLTLEKIFSSYFQNSESEESLYPVEGYSSKENMWEKLC